MSELLDLSGASFPEVKSTLGLTRNNNEPFYRNINNRIVMFRSEHQTRDRLVVPFDDNSVYGKGAYLGNSPASVVTFLGTTNRHGVNAYELPEIDDSKIRRCYTRLLVDTGNAELVVFPAPLTTRALFGIAYPESRHEELPQCWGLLRETTAADKIQQATKIAWLGRECLGPSKMFRC